MKLLGYRGGSVWHKELPVVKVYNGRPPGTSSVAVFKA